MCTPGTRKCASWSAHLRLRFSGDILSLSEHKLLVAFPNLWRD
jgi:hypothetical protein